MYYLVFNKLLLLTKLFFFFFMSRKGPLPSPKINLKRRNTESLDRSYIFYLKLQIPAKHLIKLRGKKKAWYIICLPKLLSLCQGKIKKCFDMIFFHV